MADENKPYIGYRSAGRRPERNNDREAAKDLPVATIRGLLAGALGAPGDIESFGGSAVNWLRDKGFQYDAPFFPTSDSMEAMLPLRSVSTTPAGKAVTEGAKLVGGNYFGPGSPLRALVQAPGAIAHGAREFVRAAGAPSSNVVKNKGGNWLAGSLEDSLRGLRRDPEAEAVRQLMNARPGLTTQEARDFIQAPPLPPVDSALNNWIDKTLAKYIKNEMATPEDPVRALAERGMLHQDFGDEARTGRRVLTIDRVDAGFPAQGLASSEQARGWENMSDFIVNNDVARRFMATTGEDGTTTVSRNPWLAKVPPETIVHSIFDDLEGRSANRLGFNHLIDELRNATNPASGLPPELLLKYESLPKVTVPQAVERVAKINEWRAAQKAEADMMRANNAASVVHKEYATIPGLNTPNDKGLRWVELKVRNEPEGGWDAWQVPQRYSIVRPTPSAETFAIMDKETGKYITTGLKSEKDAVTHLHDTLDEAALEDALKYEGETMGHCVGGYCPDVMEGRSRIYSLRDAKGQPHVTVEVLPGRKLTEADLPDSVRDQLADFDGSREEFEVLVQKSLSDRQIGDRIAQIKGKANLAPKEEYLPFVQDFVRSGQWSDVGDLGNAGLVDLQRFPKRMEALGGRFVPKSELDNYLESLPGERFTPPEPFAPPEGYAAGGLVQANDYDESEIDAIVANLRKEFA